MTGVQASPTAPVVGAPAKAPGTAVEQRGIEYIPLAERHGTPLDVARMWAGAIFNIEYVVYGALVVSLGLTFAQAVVVILIGNLSFVLTGLASLHGPAAGTTAFGVSRAPFGPNGNRFVAVCNWVLQVGYETLGLSLITLAALVLLAKAGLHSSTALKVIVILVAASLQGVLPVFGHGVILRTLSLLVAPFVVLFVLLAILTIGKANLGAGHPASLAVVMIALALAISSTGLGWTMSGSDYSRYLHPRTSRARIVWSVALGGAIPSVLLMLLGAAVATAVTSATDPISGLPQAFPAWFLVPYLIFVIVQIYAINSLDLYSSSVTLQAIGLRLRRYQAVLIDTCISCVLTGAIIFSSSFYTYLTDFLLFMVIWFSPWVAIFLVDYVLRRGRYDARSLLDPRAGIYWRRGGVHVPGVIAQLLGMVASAMWIDTTVFKGPLSSATNGADLSIYMGIVVGGVVYYVLARHGVRDEAARTPSIEEADAQATAASLHAV